MKRFVYLGIAVIVVVALWSGAWLFIAGIVKTNIDAQASNDGITAPRLVCETLDIGGYPFRFDADCTNAQIASGDLTVTVPGLRASVLVYRPTHLLASAEGPATLVDAFTGARNAVSWDDLEASLRVIDWRIERLSVVGGALRWTDTLMGEALIGEADAIEMHLLDIPEIHDDTAGTSGLAGYVQSSGLVAPGVGVTAGQLTTEAELTGLPDDLRLWGEPDALQRWQQAGGRFELVSLQGTDGDNYLTAEGNVALTDTGLLDGQVAIKSNGVVEQIAPMFPEPYGPLLLGNPAEDGSYSQTISLRGGVIMSGLLPAGAVPPLF